MEDKIHLHEPLLQNDAVVLGLLFVLLGGIFITASSQHKAWKRFYSVVPSLLLCYFLPSVFTSLGVIAPKWYDLQALAAGLSEMGYALPTQWSVDDLHAGIKTLGLSKEDLVGFKRESMLYFAASRYFLPASLVLLTLSISIKELVKLGPKALIMFFTGTVGVVVGGPFAVLAFSYLSPEVVGGQGPDAVWRGMTTIAGSWVGGGANQAAMFEVFKPSSRLYSIMITVDVIVAEIWMAFLLIGVGKSAKLDRFFKADSSAVDALKNKMHEFSEQIARKATFTDLIVILAIGLGATGLAHLISDFIAPYIGNEFPSLKKFSLDSKFFWLIVLATTFGLVMSFTKLRNYEGAGASKLGSVFIYFLVATIGMKMNIMEILDNPMLFLVGLLWMAIHVGLLVLVAKLIRSPFFFLAVGSKANIGGAASAPVVAAAFHPSLAPVGVILAVLGYALGTYGAYICGLLMQGVAPL